MLTADLVQVRKQGGELRVRPLAARARETARLLAEGYLALAKEHEGRTREELDAAWDALEGDAHAKRVAGGLRKLTSDACVFEAPADVDPVVLRRTIFTRANERRHALGDGALFDRAAVVAEVAQALGLDSPELEASLFGDLRGAEILSKAPIETAETILEAYDLAQAQAVLLRAVRVTCHVRSASPGLLRTFFARLKFLQLLFAVEPGGEDGAFVVTIDGPFSMFGSVTRYGLRLAQMLPLLRALESWSLVADVRWGKAREALIFRLEASADHVAGAAASAQPLLSDDVRILRDGLRAMASGWHVDVATTLLTIPGLGVCIPDLVLRRDSDPEPVYVEVLGFWSRDAVFRRIELAERGLGARIVFAASARLRVSAELLDDSASSALYVFKGKMSPRTLLDRVEAIATSSASCARRRNSR